VRNLRVVVVDSIFCACCGERVEEEETLAGATLARLGARLRDLARRHRLAVLVTNAARFESSSIRLGATPTHAFPPRPGVTDESSAIEALGLAPRLVEGGMDNFKITWPADFALAAALLETRMNPTSIRIGEGWDTHALVAGRPLVLGGITIPHTHGLLGHSDADALLHAITDALLGAAGLGDIGRHFPDTDPAFKGADSGVLLQEAARRVRAAGWAPVNVDSTIVAQAPKMAPHIGAMRERIAALLGLPADAVNVKAKTAEKMGPVGEGLSIETRAVCLLARAP
jgi:2-C-methyl-D-erythritol 2,4-cyclodiphosphate synthase